ncbi:hypothetical protein BIW11_13836 [Tropilaelaps mercedesae]|uniref:Uncharacterized protein n=1 Tax=Tropilaelaps mercedesae TaxID=418985 RepID=A0A1V9X0S4_9ACAR|nr:hypothetical protein BIW11_13836 [Tropilaelaps mercedesae]
MTHENVEVAQANNAKPEVSETATKPVVEGKEAALKIETLNGKAAQEATGDKVGDAAEINGHITADAALSRAEASTSEKKDGEEKSGDEKSDEQKDQEKAKKKGKRFSFNKLMKMFSFKEKDRKKDKDDSTVKEDGDERKEAETPDEAQAGAAGDAKTEEQKGETVAAVAADEQKKPDEVGVGGDEKVDDSTKTEEKKE